MTSLKEKNKINFKLVKLAAILLITSVILSYFGIKTYHSNLLEERRNDTKHFVSSAYKLIDYYHKKEKDGSLTTSQAQTYALEAVKLQSKPTEKYFWIINTNAIMMMHPHRPEFKNKNMINFVSPDGKFLVKEMVHIAKTKGNGFVKYLWNKPTEKKENLYEKISYVKLYKPWKWVIASGVYIDDINKSFWNTIYISIGIVISSILFITSLRMIVKRKWSNS